MENEKAERPTMNYWYVGTIDRETLEIGTKVTLDRPLVGSVVRPRDWLSFRTPGGAEIKMTLASDMSGDNRLTFFGPSGDVLEIAFDKDGVEGVVRARTYGATDRG